MPLLRSFCFLACYVILTGFCPYGHSMFVFSSETGSITILISNDNNSSYTLDLYTVFGQLVESQKIINGSKINTENLSQGIYICKVSEMNSVGSEKTGGLIKRILIRH